MSEDRKKLRTRARRVRTASASAEPSPTPSPSPKAGAPHVVGRRVDWMAFDARVKISAEVLRDLRDRGKLALRLESPQAFLLGRWEGRLQPEYGAEGARAFRLMAPGRDGKWLLQNDLMRVTITERGAGVVPELASSPFDVEGERPESVGWTTRIEMSGVALLIMGYEGAIREGWKVAELLGDLYEARFGRIDACADVANYDLRADDQHSFVKVARVKWGARFHDGRLRTKKKRRKLADGEEVVETASWHQDGRKIVNDDDAGTVQSYCGDTFTGFSFGLSRTSVSGRIYDKVLELRTPKKGAHGLRSDKRESEFEGWRRGGWKGMAEEPSVTRIEFEVRGDALTELGLRVPTKPETGGVDAMVRAFATALDPAWQYFTRKWLRLVRRGTPDVAQPRWRAVQEVTFEGAAAPTKRVRKHGGAKAPQSLGAAISLLASTGKMPPLPWKATHDAHGEVDPFRFKVDPDALVDELVEGLPEEEAERQSRQRLHAYLGEVMQRAGGEIAKCGIERYGSARGALGNVFGRAGASLARFHLATDEWLREGAGQPVYAVA